MDHINYLLNLRALVAEEKETLSSDDALAVLRKKLQTEPSIPIVNHVDREIYINNPGDAIVRHDLRPSR